MGSNEHLAHLGHGSCGALGHTKDMGRSEHDGTWEREALRYAQEATYWRELATGKAPAEVDARHWEQEARYWRERAEHSWRQEGRLERSAARWAWAFWVMTAIAWCLGCCWWYGV